MSAKRVNELLHYCDRLPPDLAAWLRGGLRAWQQGSNLETALEIDGPRLSDDERDNALRGAMALLPVGLDDQAPFLAGLLERGERHPDPAGEQLLRMLRAARCRIPASIKQLRRIQRGRRSDGWRGTYTGVVSARCCAGR